MKMLKRFPVFLLIAVLMVGTILPMEASAASTVFYMGRSDEFIFSPDNGENPDNLFPEFQNVMPGDELTQSIVLKNRASNRVYIKAYLRSKGAVDDASDLLSQLELKVVLKKGTKVLYEGPADETGKLSDWVHLGTLQSGGKVELEVTLKVPVDMTSEFADQTAGIQWEFRVEEYPVTDSAKTGDTFDLVLWLSVFLTSLLLLAVLFFTRRRKQYTE